MTHYFQKLFLLATLLLVAIPNASGQKKINVVTTLPDLAFIADAVGGDQVESFSIATGYQDPHFVDPKPSYIVKLSRADVFVTIGLDLETGWVPPLLNSARNEKILKGAPGYVDASRNIPLLEVPSSTSREQGDIHVYGNPHYWMDPANGKIIAQNIYEGLVQIRPERQAYFASNLAQFQAKVDEKMVEWSEKMKPYKGTKIIAYHNQWPYFESAMGLDIEDFLEPKPGIPPTPSQLAKIIGLMTQQKISVIIIAPYYRPDSAELVARRVGAKVVPMASSVGAFKDVKTYFDIFDYDVDLLIKAFNSTAP